MNNLKSVNRLRALSFNGIGLHNSKYINNGGIKKVYLQMFVTLFVGININLVQ